MSTTYHAAVIIGFEVKPSELDLSEMPAQYCPKRHIRKGSGDKFCATCGGTFKKDPEPKPTLIEQYAKKVGRDPNELFDDWHEGYEDNELCLRSVAQGVMVLGKAWSSMTDYKMGQLHQLDPKRQSEITSELHQVRDDLGMHDRPIQAYLVMDAG